MDLLSHQKIFKPGGVVKIICGTNGTKIIYGFLLKWEPPSPNFDIIDTSTHALKTFNYLNCKEVWYTPKEVGKKIVNLVRDLESGKKEFKPLKDEDRAKLINFLKEVAEINK